MKHLDFDGVWRFIYSREFSATMVFPITPREGTGRVVSSVRPEEVSLRVITPVDPKK